MMRKKQIALVAVVEELEMDQQVPKKQTNRANIELLKRETAA